MEMEEFHGISINYVKIHKTLDFCVTETPETAESTKPYELLLQIGGIRTIYLPKWSFSSPTPFKTPFLVIFMKMT